ncbi:DNA-processing protein DprA [Eubacteriaceae bacterium ES2]|nr:DNA-processing protein DprA [Eubacteriaceae bacterium ES2]
MDDCAISNLLTLTQISGLGRKRIKKLLKKSDLINNSLDELLEMACDIGIIKVLPTEQSLKMAADSTADIFAKNARYGIKMMTYFDDDFPKCLLYDDGPVVIYYLGNIDCLDINKRVAVIGSRNPDQNGIRFAYNVAKEIALQNGVIISGLALGCDTAGHRGALSVKGRTLAFLPSGLLNIYPEVNRTLAHEILDNGGGLISEYSLATDAHVYQFVERDRLQAAASQIVMVSSFAQSSGTLHTLKFANKYSRSIYTIEEIVKRNPTGFGALNALEISYSIINFSEIVDVLDQL